MDFQDRNNVNDSDVNASEGANASPASANGRTVVLQPDANNVVTLPEGVSFDNIVADGRNLIIQAGGITYVIPDGAIIVPQLVVDGVTVPPLNLAALLIGNEPVPAAGPGVQSSGGNFATAPGDIQAAYALGDLLPYTELTFPQPEDQEIIPNLADRDPTVIVITPNNPAGATDAVAEVDEAGLPARNGEPAGTEQETTSETTTGTISYTAPDGTSAVQINGVAITAIGQQFVSPDGTLTITSIAEGAIGFSYTLGDNLLGVTQDGFFTVTVIDTDGDTASASLLINVIDDAPIARNDSDAIAAGTYGPESGNVITGTGTVTGQAGADNVGADGASLSGIANSSGVTSGVTAQTIISGAYGTLTIAPDGSYTYVRAAGSPGGVSDTFTYTLTDGDGSTATAVLTINIGDSPATVISVPGIGDPGTIVDEAGLPRRDDEAPGTEAPTPAETTSGTITYVAPDKPATVTINGEVITATGQVITTPEGTLTITKYDPVTGTIDYTFTLSDNTGGDDTSVTFDVTVTDVDGDSDSGSFTITIVDDVPLAVDDSAVQSGENSPVTVNVFANDIQGADSVQLDAIAAVPGTLTGGGTVAYNGDGTFTYTPAPGEEGSVSFDYSITDGDGDVSVATVTIQLNQDSNPSIDTAGDRAVDEAGLPARGAEPAGSQEASDSETAVGTISITTGGDAIGSLVINGVNVTNGGSVTTAKGTLVVTLDAGQYTYAYTLADNTLSDPDSDTFALTVTDSDGDTASTSLVIAIADDAPSAADDAAGIAAGLYGPVTGNVTANDVSGADDFAVTSYSSAGDTGLAGGVVQGLYGKLTIDTDGNFSYTRDPGTPGGVSDTFSYTVTDGDGDVATASLVISIADSGTTLDLPTTGEAGTQVLEEGLPAGSNAASNGEFTAGTIGFTAPDSPATVTINGVAVASVGQTFTGSFGTLTITSVTNGVIGYSYELTTNTNGDSTADSFAVVVTDVDGDSTPGTLTIDIVDDVPTARADVDSVTEDGPLTADGNVITGADLGDANQTDGVADTPGADGATVVAVSLGATSGSVGTGLVSAYGTLTLDDNGDYRYVLDNNNPLVQGLDSTETLTETYTYTIRDGDGDESTTTLVITIQGADDGVTINGLDGQGAEETVFEDDLLDGSSPDPAGLTQSGSFDLTSPDGLSTITVGGTTIYTGGAFVPGQTLSTAYGTLTITGVTPTTTDANGDVTAATVSYSYQLDDNTLTHTAADDVSLTDSFSVVVTDTDGSTATDSLEITVVDDVPTANNDTATQTTENQPFTIDALNNDVFGADGVDTTDITDVFVATQASQGVVTYDPVTGLFTYTPNAGAGGSSTSDSFTYTIIDADGDASTATVTITLQPDSTPAVVNVTALSDDDGLGGANPAPAANDIDANVGDNPLTASEAIYSGKITVDFGGDSGTVSFANLNGTSGTVGTETVNYTWNAGTNTLTATGPRGILFTVSLDAAGNYVLTQIDNVLHAAGNGETSAPPVVLAYIATDSDGDSSTDGTLSITFNDDVPTAVADTNSVTEGSNVGGNVLTDGIDDSFGADGPTLTSPAGGVIGFAAGSDISVPATGTPGTTIESALGFLTLNSDGSYSYASKANSTNSDTTDTFVYTIQDADGDTSTQTLTISVDNVTGNVSDNDVLVDEAGLDANGSQGGTDSEVDADGQIIVTGASGTLIYTLLDPADGTFGTLVLDSATGAYTYTLDTPVTDTTGDDGRNTVSGAINGAEEFDYQVTDTFGNLIGTGTIVINIVDDVPTANNDTATQTTENQPFTIDALNNDVFAADGVDTTDITDVFVATQASQGVVTYDPVTGLFTYTPNAGAGSTSTSDSFTYTIIDGDGDASTATVTITLQPDSTPAVVNVTALSDDDGLAGANPAPAANDIDANVGDNPLTASEAIYSGKITVDFGGDSGTVSFANLNGTSGTVGTETVNYTWNAGTNTL
ncbi:tandem-95 repeat protein, partial [Altererythrobacter confluentis]